MFEVPWGDSTNDKFYIDPQYINSTNTINISSDPNNTNRIRTTVILYKTQDITTKPICLIIEQKIDNTLSITYNKQHR